MIVDVQNHLLPLSLASDAPDAGIIDTHSSPPMFRWRGISMTVNEEFTDIELHLRVCRDAGLTHIMLHQGMLLTVANEILGMSTVAFARLHNETMARLTEPYKDFVFPYGYLRPHDGREAVEEAERCVESYGFKALAIDTSYGTTSRMFPHTVETFEFWEYVNEKEIPVYIHPAMLAYGWEWMDRYKLDETVARPNETALSVSLMILSGLFDRFPKLKIILAHMGGSFTMCLPRLQFGHRLGYEGFLEYQKAVNIREPVEYARDNLWVDTMGFSPPGIKHAIEVYGIDHVLLGTDYGPIPISPEEHIRIIRNDLELSSTEQEKILGLNAKELFGLQE